MRAGQEKGERKGPAEEIAPLTLGWRLAAAACYDIINTQRSAFLPCCELLARLMFWFVCATALLLADVSSLSFPWFIGKVFVGADNSQAGSSPPSNAVHTRLCPEQ